MIIVQKLNLIQKFLNEFQYLTLKIPLEKHQHLRIFEKYCSKAMYEKETFSTELFTEWN